MSRPLRIERASAWYYIQNVGRSGHAIFRSPNDYQIFLDLLKETAERFNVEIHSYALVSKQYHLLIKTKEANLGLAMRHLNGIYTQQFNRQHELNGTLFKGRYKATLLDPVDYPLVISRHIHREYLSAKKGKAHDENSSYSSYIGKSNPPTWLNRDELYRQQGKRQRYTAYGNYVDNIGLSPSVDLPRNDSFPALLGRRGFIEQFRPLITQSSAEVSERKTVFPKPKAKEIVKIVCVQFDKTRQDILKTQRGRNANNEARHTAMLLCQQCANMNLKDIAGLFGLNHYASVSNQISALKREMLNKPELNKKIEKLSSNLMLEANYA